MKREISARVIADSISSRNYRLTTMEVTFPRFLLAEFNTHRAFSRNSASSRARSAKKVIQEVSEDPFVPSHWPSEHLGMSGGQDIMRSNRLDAEATWRAAAHTMCNNALNLADSGVHKSIINRLLEPFMWHTAVVTATEWTNFFHQRLALLPDGRRAAEPHFYDLAMAMKVAIRESKPVELSRDEWHLPYVDVEELEQIASELKDRSRCLAKAIRLSVARCAGVSYLNQNKKRDHSADLDLFWRLESAKPPHWSPFEHVARPIMSRSMVPPVRYNLTGWCSLRYYVEMGAILEDVIGNIQKGGSR